MAWTVTESVYMNRRARDGMKKKSVKLECTSDASGLDQEIATGGLRGLYFYGAKYLPDGDDTPTSIPTIKLVDENSFEIFSEAVGAADTAQFIDGSATLGVYPLIDDKTTVQITTLANTKKATFIFQFIER